MFKLLIVLMFVAILGSLFSGLFYIYKDREGGQKAVRALTWRIGLSVTLFALLMIGFRLGLIAGN